VRPRRSHVADVAVVGAGFAGMAAAARLAKLGHAVTVFEQQPTAGGRLRTVEQDGFRWDAGESSTGLPAVVRDLFRKSGRPIERYVDLTPVPPRRHVFPGGDCVDLPMGSRAEQTHALDAGLGAGSGRLWTEFVDGQADVWDRFRRSPAGPDWDGSQPAPRADLRLPVRRSLRHLLSRALPDQRLRAVASHRWVLAGSDLRRVPALAAVDAYVDRSFGIWRSPSGLGELREALVLRLAERGVDVRYGSPVTSVDVRGGRVTGVEVGGGARFAADVVVASIDPLVVFAELLGGEFSRAVRVFSAGPRVAPAAVTRLGLRGADAGSDGDVVLHGDPLVVVSAGGTAPAGHCVRTVRMRGGTGDDVLAVMASRGLDLRADVVTRLDGEPPGSAVIDDHDTGWDGWRAYLRRSALAEPVGGLYVLGARLTPGATIPEVGWTAAHVAGRIGKA
jgi:phytoene dehydrogenase-like protein